jgi:cytochrome b
MRWFLRLLLALNFQAESKIPMRFGGEPAQDLHELLANALILVACIHVPAVLWIHFRLKLLLRHRMCFGRKYETKVSARDF